MLKFKSFFLPFLLFLSIISLIHSSLKFNIPSYRDKCFGQEFYLEGTLLIKYDLTGFENDYKGNDQVELFKNIKIFIKDEAGKIIHETELKSRKEKYAVYIPDRGNYLVCARYYRPRRSRDLPSNVMLGLKIRNDYYYKKLDDSLHKEDVSEFWRKIRDIKRDMRPSLEASRLELKEEDKTAKSMISSINTYYVLSCIQLVIILVITMCAIFNFQEFFKKKSII